MAHCHRNAGVVLLLALCLFHAKRVLAAPCDDHFSSKGNFLSGKVFKTFADLPNINNDEAFSNIVAFTAGTGFTITASDRQTGTISAAQTASLANGKKIPLEIIVEKIANGTRVSMTYTTPVATASPDSAVRTHFCKTMAAASNGWATTTTATTTGSAVSGASPAAAVAAETPTQQAAPQANPTRSDYAKNGLPCVNEICLGDGIDDLAKVAWDKARADNGVTGANGQPLYTTDIAVAEGMRQEYGKTFKGDISGAIQYLHTHTFDGVALQQLTKVTTACSPSNLIGRYTTASGNPTQVTIGLLPTPLHGSSTTQQRWVVVEIYRTFPAATSLLQTEAVMKDLQARYRRWMNNGELAGQAFVTANPSGGLDMGLHTGGDILRRQQLNPACGSAPVKID